MIDWFDLLAAQRTLKSLLQHHGSKASILHCSAFFMVQLSHPYMTTVKTVALTRWTLDGRIMFLLFNTLSRFVSYSKNEASFHFMQPPSTVILEPRKTKSLTVSIASPSTSMKSWN